ncbi:YggS family pyridoxal phosphate-dependent enzyme [Deferribacteraceae bacterium V6Fe1]|nr:YggS family pyridoxal phosphate-dependent enzyme [Deferribacteraceae bacterium V6Fe1]
MNEIRNNLENIYKRIELAASKAGRKKGEITLVAVSKTYPAEKIIEAYECGQCIFGENRVQEALDKIDVLKDYKGITFHLIGHLQTNKVKYLKDNFSLIHSLDRIELVEEMEKRFSKLNRVQDVLIQVNIAKEPQKSGVLPEDFNLLLDKVLKSNFLNLKGLMMIPPFLDNPEDNRIYFRKMYELFEKVNTLKKVEYLSMGMSDDFEIAIEEGSNMVRIGSAIFGKRG